MRAIGGLIAIGVVSLVLVCSAAQSAAAEPPNKSIGNYGGAFVGKAWDRTTNPGRRDRPGNRGRSPSAGTADNALPANGPVDANGVPYLRCGNPCMGVANSPAAAVPPEVTAREAVARLNLTAPTPAIGPPPSINKWRMAAVGYPLWLWVEGNTDPAPVTDSDGGLSVSLDARVTGISFDMGDGHTVSCLSAGTKWHRSVAPGKASPTCGYRYDEPSLPQGNYTVTATTHWAVDWNINGVTGTIPYDQSATTSLPVGELQVLIR